VTLLTTVFIGASLVAACSARPARPAHSVLLSLTCAESAGQQGQGGETVTGGVEGLVLPGSDDPAGLYPVGKAGNGKPYFIYKAFLAVSASAAPCSAPIQASLSSRPRAARYAFPCAGRALRVSPAAS